MLTSQNIFTSTGCGAVTRLFELELSLDSMDLSCPEDFPSNMSTTQEPAENYRKKFKLEFNEAACTDQWKILKI